MIQKGGVKLSNIFGIVPSRRLGRSLGLSTIPISTCTYSCVYCQLGRTRNMTMERKIFFNIDDLCMQLEAFKEKEDDFDVITLVGEGEPTLYAQTGVLINRIKKLFNKPVALITNGSLFFHEAVRQDCINADIVMPTLDAWDDESFTILNRPMKQITFEKMYQGLRDFKKVYKGNFYLEIMCVKGITDQGNNRELLTEKVKQLNPDKVYINTPVRPPAEKWVKRCSKDFVEDLREQFMSNKEVEIPDTKLYSHHQDLYQAIIEIIKRHPLDQSGIESFCKNRHEDPIKIIKRLTDDVQVEKIYYENKVFFRIKSMKNLKKEENE